MLAGRRGGRGGRRVRIGLAAPQVYVVYPAATMLAWTADSVPADG